VSASRLDIRPALLEDLPHLTALYTHLNPNDPPCPPETAAEALGSINALKGSAVLIGVFDGILVTSCTVFVLPNLTRGGDPYALIENRRDTQRLPKPRLRQSNSEGGFSTGIWRGML